MGTGGERLGSSPRTRSTMPPDLSETTARRRRYSDRQHSNCGALNPRHGLPGAEPVWLEGHMPGRYPTDTVPRQNGD